MGADLIATALLLPRDTHPNWDAAEEALSTIEHDRLMMEPWSRAFDWTDFFDYADEPDTPEVRHEILTNALETVKEMYTKSWRNTVLQRHRSVTVWIVGETSWGEEPHGWTELCMFMYSPLLTKAGFKP